MNLKNISKEELQNMSYDDIAYNILLESKKQMKIIDLFNEVGKLIDLSSSEIEEKIEILSLDKRFIMLDNGLWDLKNRQAQKIVMDDDEEDIALEDIDDSLEEEEEEEDEIFYDEDDNDDSDDDLKDLVVIDEEEESNF